MNEHEVECADGVWKVLLKGDECCIVDPQGRQRHQSKGHHMTATFLAMKLAERPLESEPNMDEALRMQAEQFAREVPQ